MDKRLVLVIDDDEHMQAFYRDALAPYYYTRRALRGFKGIELAKGEAPDLVVVDIDMPEMNGFDFISAYRKATGLDTPFVVVSSYDNETFKSRAKALGVKLYLKKPVDDLHLVSAIETVFEMEMRGYILRNSKGLNDRFGQAFEVHGQYVNVCFTNSP